MAISTVHPRLALRTVRSRGVKHVAGILVGMLGLSLLALQAAPVASAHAASGLYYQRGYYVDNGWLCYGWSDGAYHCTKYWHRDGSQLVSDNPSWVPNGLASSGAYAGGAGGFSTRTTSYSAAPAGISQWGYTGHPAYAMSDFRGDPYTSEFGWCTWWAWYTNRGEPLMQLGNAAQWAYSAPAHGLRVTSYPVVGATAVFQSGVQGASSGGHVAHVEAVYSNGWFLVSEMAFYWNGGGWGRVSYRYAHTGPGVSFIL